MVYQCPSLIVSDHIATCLIDRQFPYHSAALPPNEGEIEPGGDIAARLRYGLKA